MDWQNIMLQLKFSMEEYEGDLTVNEKKKGTRHLKKLFFNNETFKAEPLCVFLFEKQISNPYKTPHVNK
jgi:hypothetical protein